MIEQIPLFHALRKHANQDPVSFHVPGHKNGTIVPGVAGGLFSELLKIDATELSELDDLHDPQACIKDAQDLAAAYYQVKKTYFLVNGSTVGNLAMILAVAQAGDIVLVQRNCHKSIMNGLQLAGARPVFITPEYDLKSKVAGKVSDALVREAIVKYPQAKALILTHPNYYGMGWNLETAIMEAHAANIPVLVDEAHGAHFGIGEGFPPSAIQYGADVIVQSAHKTLPAMTMGSFLHYNSSRVNQEKLERYLQMLQSSSPSYPIMASLDLSRYYLSEYGKPEAAKIMKSTRRFCDKLAEEKSLKIIQESELDGYTLDPLKVMIQSRHGQSGFALLEALERHNIYAEMADAVNVLLILPLAKLDDPDRLAQEVREAVMSVFDSKKASDHRNPSPWKQADIVELPYPYQELEGLAVHTETLAAAEGMIAAEALVPYPPGIPLLQTGERIQRAHYEQAQLLMEAGARFQGKANPLTDKIKVFHVKHFTPKNGSKRSSQSE